MQSPAAPPPRVADPVARRFFRRAFGIFIAFAVLLTLVLVGETVWMGREGLRGELAIYQRSFEKPLAEALWAMDRDKLQAIVQGIGEIPDIHGVRLREPGGGAVLAEVGRIPPAGASGPFTLAHRFPVVHGEGHGREVVAEAEFHSSALRLWQRTRGQVLLIVVLAALKTLAFWGIFLYVGRRLLGEPLTEMSAAMAAPGAAEGLRLSPATERAIAGTELERLRQAYDGMAERTRLALRALELINEQLERRVRSRTRELEEANGRLEALAHTDVLTGVANRRQFLARAEAEIGRARHGGRPLGLVVCDIDLFKQINDSHGHGAGDAALRHVAGLLRQALREGDLVARFGGDEFVLLLPGVGLAGAGQVAARVQELLREQVLRQEDGRPLEITLSIGIAALEPGDERLEDLFHRADGGLYAAKRAGRNRIGTPAG